MNPMSVGEHIAMLLWDIGEGVVMTAARLWCQQHGEGAEAARVSERLLRLQRRQWLTREQRAREIVYRLTATGRQGALGGRDPIVFWNRPTSGRWYLIVFDLPEEEQVTRQRLLRWLRRNGFGYLQDSVWISPDSPREIAKAVERFRDDVEALTVLEARCAAGYRDDALVSGAWKFETIQRRYQALIAHCQKQTASWNKRAPSTAAVGEALATARKLWLSAVTLDPLLPRALWPEGYAGEEALNALRNLRNAARKALRLPLV